MTARVITIVVNPNAGGKPAQGLISQIEQALASRNVTLNVLKTVSAEDAQKQVCDARRAGQTRFAVAGGDGSIHAVVNGLVHGAGDDEAIGELAVFPAGTCNDLAFTLGLPNDVEQFANAVAGDHSRQIDIAKLHVKSADTDQTHYFVNNFGVGLLATVVERYNDVKWLQGQARYIVASLRAFLKYRATGATVRWNKITDDNLPGYMLTNETEYTGQMMLVTVCNNRRAGGEFLLTPDAQMDSGYIDAGILARSGKLSLVRVLFQAMRGTHINHRNIKLFRTDRLVISGDERLPVQADGELVSSAATRVEVGLCDRRLDVLMPL